MLEKPDIPDAAITACLHDEYALNVAQLEFLPLGADRDTAVYRAVGDDETAYFVKLRSGIFDEMTIIVPKRFHDQGVKSIIAPLSTQSDQLWANLGDFKLAVFSFIDGHDGYEVDLRDHHWIEFGRALKGIHTAVIPPTVTARVQRETYSNKWRETVKNFLKRVEESSFQDPISAELAAFLQRKTGEINELIRRADTLASVLQTRPQSFILCHADIHAGNVLVDANDDFYIVDWDTLILAPKERDLMYVGGGQFLNKRSPDEEETLFYQGYGQTQADPVGLAYYRYERIVQDIAEYCEQILLTEGDSEDREEGLRQLTGQFEPGNVVALAYRSEKDLPQEYRSDRVE